MSDSLRTIYNGSSLPLADIPIAGSTQFLQTILDAADRGWRVVSYFGIPGENVTSLVCVLANKAEGQLAVTRTETSEDHFPSIAPLCTQVQLFEREIAEQCGLVFDDHPWFKPVRFHRAFVPGRDAWNRPADDPIRVGGSWTTFR